MKTVRAVYGNGIFRPLDPVELPDGAVVEFEPRVVLPGEPALVTPLGKTSAADAPDGTAGLQVADETLRIKAPGGTPRLQLPGETPRLQKAGETPELPDGWKPVLQEFDPTAELEVRWRNLPHWRQEGAAYFVTFRLGDALPPRIVESLQAERLAWLQRHPPPVSPRDLRAFQALFSDKVEAYLAAGYGACHLRRPDIAELVENSLQYFDDQRYSLGRYVLMPNHIHLLVLPWPGHDLSAILHSWKSYTANQINKLLQRHGVLWQQESFDHLVRSEAELGHYQRYIEANPVHARLAAGTYRLGCGRGLPSQAQ